MRFALISFIVALLAAVTMAVPPNFYDVIISFPKEAPDYLLDEAKQAVRNGKGTITHEYTIIKGFSAKVPGNLFAGIRALSTEFPAIIEGDGLMTTQKTGTGDEVGI
ncbi:hypothetical protein N0V90_011049 [Kalmusia sp. IMI 367209]|nr:hypothetical protein N0V90_011049 [Kalmusia sp. IMI 367209]